ncbi:methyltransferase domain-containing protein [Flavobacteriaceae bacterium F89]|uniref:Methyltransferase domain-containing protein n=1 Tax=Cerina litoralis TaxID=2874477 RepID=A0AAE3EQY6_9FLAO|nr:methyltransferase domain-containing protein [Cerina litoralis]MCG2459383.1 methyltransferase domain-containing protein [Cerina litoralis]
MGLLKRDLNTEQTKKDFKQVAWFYNMWSRLTESKAANKVIEYADIHNGERIIEIACGTGVVFKEIVKRNPEGENLGIDLSNDMLAKARKLLKKEDAKSYELRQGDIFELYIESESYDKLVNNFMIDLMPEETFDEILLAFYKVLKPNGLAIISTFSFGRKKVNKFWVWLAGNFPKLLTECRPVEIKNNLKRIGFEIEKEIEISQNTFPSKVYKLRKP